MKKLLYILCVVTILASCNKSEEVALNGTPEGKTRLTIALNQESNSPARKITGTTEGSTGMDFEWAEGDVIIVEVADAQKKAKEGTQAEFKMISLVDNVATFEGELPEKAEGEFYHVIAGDTEHETPGEEQIVVNHSTDLLPDNVMRFESNYLQDFDQSIVLHPVWAILRLNITTDVKDKETILGTSKNMFIYPNLKFQIIGTIGSTQKTYTYTPEEAPECFYNKSNGATICCFLVLEPGTYTNTSVGIYYRTNDAIIDGKPQWVTSKTETINIGGVSYHGKKVSSLTLNLDAGNYLPIEATDYKFEFEAAE